MKFGTCTYTAYKCKEETQFLDILNEWFGLLQFQNVKITRIWFTE